MMEDSVIVVKHPFLKKVVGWLERRSKAIRALVATVVLCLGVGLGSGLVYAIVLFFGWMPVALTVLFLLLWAKVYGEMD